MKFFLLIFISTLMFLVARVDAQDLDAQSVNELKQSFIDSYGPDQNLVSGIRYYNLHAQYAGHKFFQDDKFVKGKLYLESGIYDDVLLKYNLYGQQLIIQIHFKDGTHTEIIVTDSRLKGFELEQRSFKKLYFPQTDTLLFQLIGDGDPVCYYHWTIEVIPNSTGLQSVYEFSKMKRKSYVLTGSTLHSFRGARSFAKVFPAHRPQVMSYIRKEKIRLRKANDGQMKGLILHCTNLLNTGENR